MAKLMKKEELAKYFDVSPRTVQQWRYANSLPSGSVLKAGRFVLYDVEKIEEFFREKGKRA